MANIKSSAKRNKLIKKAHVKNKAERSFLRTSLKNFNIAVNEGDRLGAEAAYKTAVKTVDRAATKRLIHRNNASRKVSAMSRALNSMESK